MSPKEPKTGDATDEAAFIAEALRAEAAAILYVAADHEQADWHAAVDLLAGCDGHVVVAGMGKSGLIGAKISATFSSLGQPSNVLHPAEAVHGDLGRVRRGDVVMLLSYSGETEEVVNLAAILQADRVPRLGISSRPTTTLARLSTVHLSVGDVTEACPLNLAPTASTTAMLAIGDALALAISRRRNFGLQEYQKHHPGGMLGAGLRPILEALRFRVGENLPVVPDGVTVREALEHADRTPATAPGLAPTPAAGIAPATAAGHGAGSGRRAGAIILVDDRGRLSGIFTDSDFRRLMKSDPNGMDRPIRKVMTRRPQHMTVDDLVRDAVRLVRERRLDEIPVLDHDGRPVGLVDVQDLIAMKVVSE